MKKLGIVFAGGLLVGLLVVPVASAQTRCVMPNGRVITMRMGCPADAAPWPEGAAKPATPLARQHSPAPQATGAVPAAPARLGPGEVSAATWRNGPWPLTVGHVRLTCAAVGSGSKALMAYDPETKRAYALNGVARGNAQRLGLRPLEEIWRENPEIATTRISVGPLIEYGLKNCL